jgi:Domain of unknown function (DUF4189)
MRPILATIIFAVATVISCNAARAWCVGNVGDDCFYRQQDEYRQQELRQEEYEKMWRPADSGQSQERHRSEGIWGAIAFSPSTREWGEAYNWPTEQGAKKSALDACKQADCKIGAWYYRGCGAVYASADGAWAGKWHKSQKRAQELARVECIRQGGNSCTLIHSSCSPQ